MPEYKFGRSIGIRQAIIGGHVPGCNERTDGRTGEEVVISMDRWICQPRASERAKARGVSLTRYASNAAGVRSAAGDAGGGRGAKFTWLSPNHAFLRIFDIDLEQRVYHSAGH